MANVLSNGRLIDFEAALVRMDPGLIDAMAGLCRSEQEFIEAYHDAHAEWFGVEFDTSGLKPTE